MIEEQWEEYRRKVIHPAAPAAQLREMRMAFYAGASAMFGLLSDITGMGAAEPTPSELAKVDSLVEELMSARFL